MLFRSVAFRIVWGFVGGHHAIFANFVRMPWTVLAWLRAPTDRAAPRQAGHSPLAALSVLGLLAVTGFMAVTGMFSTDGILFDGPLAHLAPDRSAEITKIHHLAKLALIALVILHLAAGEDAFLEPATLQSIVEKYSNHVGVPIEFVEAGDGAEKTAARIDAGAALWLQPKDGISEEA